MSDYDDDDSVSSFGRMPSFGCTPLTIYMSIAVISVIIYYGYTVMKGKFPSSGTFSSICCTMMISAFMIFMACRINFIASWCMALCFSICAICFAMGKFSIPKIY
jgi:hypothetical protein